jgi:AP-2 complex subunit mu-1
MYITTESIKSEMAVVRPILFPKVVMTTDLLQREDSSKITIQATGATSWRRSDVKYRKNEAFVDVIETVNLLMSKEGELEISIQNVPEDAESPGAVLRADVDGQILMRAYLSGTPECKFGLNDKLVLQKRRVFP